MSDDLYNKMWLSMENTLPKRIKQNDGIMETIKLILPPVIVI